MEEKEVSEYDKRIRYAMKLFKDNKRSDSRK